MAAVIVYPPVPVTRMGSRMLLDGEIPQINYVSPDKSRTFFVQGGLSPLAPGIEGQDGIVLKEQSTPVPSFKHIDSQGAREDGVTWKDVVFEPTEWDMVLEANAYTASGLSRVVSDWIASWNPRQRTPGMWEYYTPEMGLWRGLTRLHDRWPDHLKAEARLHRQRIFTHTSRIDNAFWYGIDSTSKFQPGGTGGSGHVQLTNIGQMDGWSSYVVYAGTSDGAKFEFGNGPSSSEMIKFGPLRAGQIVLITTLPRLRSVVDLTPNQPPQQLDSLQKLIDTLIKLVTFNQVPPLLTWFESLFGIRPPQGVLYSLLEGRFSRPIPGVMQPDEAATKAIPVKITSGNANSKIVASVTPRRLWPE